MRLKILDRDGWRCYICGQDIDRTFVWPHGLAGSVDHVKPLSAGGSNDPDNLRGTHWHCNIDKGSRLVSEIWTAA